MNNRHGFTFVELLIAVGLVAIVGIGLTSALSYSGQQNIRRRASQNAMRIARNEAERVRMAPALVPTTASQYRLAEDGLPNATGPYRATVTRVSRCDAVARLPDDQGGSAYPTCQPTNFITVRVEYLVNGTTWQAVASHDVYAPVGGHSASAWNPAGQ